MNYSVGLEYGYSLPVARRLNLDFVIGVGYWGGEYHKYAPIDGHYVWKETRRRHWFGLTEAEISLVWLLGRGNYNEKKGGRHCYLSFRIHTHVAAKCGKTRLAEKSHLL